VGELPGGSGGADGLRLPTSAGGGDDYIQATGTIGTLYLYHTPFFIMIRYSVDKGGSGTQHLCLCTGYHFLCSRTFLRHLRIGPVVIICSGKIGIRGVI
jgi:hypothetical protein